MPAHDAGVGRTVTVRPAEARDAAGACLAHIASIIGRCGGDYTLHEIASWVAGKSPERYEALIAAGGILVAEADGRVVGVASLAVRADGEAEVTSLYVDPTAAGLGAGASLMRALEARARKAGARRMVVQSTRTAASFYERCGFRETCRGHHRTACGVEVACIGLERTLEPEAGPAATTG